MKARKLLICLFKKPNIEKARRNPRCKNPDTLGPTPYFDKPGIYATDAQVEEIRARRGKIIDSIRERLSQRGYHYRFQIFEHKSPAGFAFPKSYRLGRGPVLLYEGWV
ncbi:MAG: hypothetical protein WC350_05940 [Candidatus Micrarchaeia archaeon]|jgi:hypothetical protein